MKIQKKQNQYKNAIAFIPIILMLAVVPLIVRAKIVMLDENTAKFWTGSYQIDLFSYTKTRMIMFLTVWMLISAFFFFSKKDFKNLKDNKWVFYPVIVFVFSLIVSTMLSEHKNIAIWGAPERYEGMIVHLCYIIMFLYTYMILKTEDDFKYIKYAILFLSSVMAVIGLMQAFGKDIFNTDFMRNIIVPNEYKDMLSLSDVKNKQVYLTLQNSNYVGTYVALIMPFLLMFCISRYEHKYLRIYSGILAFLTFFILVKSGSKAGLFAVMCILLLIPIIFYKVILNLKKTTIFITIAVILFTGVGVNIATGNAITENVARIINEAKAVLVKDNDYVYDPTYGLPIYDVKLDMNRASIYTKYGILNIDFKEDGELEFRDEKERQLKTEFDKDNKWITISSFEGVNVQNIKDELSMNYLINVKWATLDYFSILKTIDNEMKFVDFRMNDYEMEKVTHIGFEGKEELLSRRGYIWSRTLPIILNKPLFGHGSDTFLAKFPQNDFPAKIYIYKTTTMITDKPHNIYLLYAINNGLVGFLSILTLWFGYIVITVKTRLFKAKHIKTDLYKIACILSVIGYLLTGILNDSVPVTAPIFWLILGAGFVLNKLAGKAYEG